MNKKKVIATLSILAGILCSLIVWFRWISPTRIALVHYPNFITASIGKANDSWFISIDDVPVENLEKISGYDAVLVSGMGLRITEEQRSFIKKLVESGKPLYVSSVTNPENEISSLDSIQQQKFDDYLSYGGRNNYRNMLRYVRKELDRKWLAGSVEAAQKFETNVFFHVGEDKFFESLSEYESFYKSNGFFKDGRPRVALVAGIADPFNDNREQLDSLIFALEKHNVNVFPIAAHEKRFSFLKQVNPDAVIYFPHGRLVTDNGDETIEWLRQNNIPLFCPVTVLQPYDDWMNNKMGMTGGFMSQTVVVPELDGSLFPYVFFSQQQDKDGLFPFRVLPRRLADFAERIANQLELTRKANSEKKLAIFYFKGPGKNALVAANLEVVPSLFQLLQRLKQEGYTVTGLPAEEKEFEHLLMANGPVLGPYAKGAFSAWLKTAKPALVKSTEYEQWASQALPEKLYKSVTDLYGVAPGDYMATSDEQHNYIAVANVQFGNVTLLPQPLPAVGEDEFKLIHGVNVPPPHPYIAAYLWTRFGFGADAIMHFGTHGSLEFIPGKAVALSDHDWPDRLIGPLPHVYYYTIGNVGEAMMAKRRSYAATVSHLTQPFMETAVEKKYKPLSDLIKEYNRTSATSQDKIARQIRNTAAMLGLLRDLNIDSLSSEPLAHEDVDRIENFAYEIMNAKMTGQHYTLGVPYRKDQLRSSVMAMTVDPIAYSLKNLDHLKASGKDKISNRLFTETWAAKAKACVTHVLDKPAIATDAFIAETAGITVAELVMAESYAASLRQARPSGRPRTVQTNDAPSSDGKQSKARSTTSASPANVAFQKGLKQAESTVPDSTRRRYLAIAEISTNIRNINRYYTLLQTSPRLESDALINALNGGYTPPTPGGDVVSNPNVLPTGRNLYGVNAEATPSVGAWEKGVELTHQFIREYQKKYERYPRKVNMTLWSSAFIETEGATIAQVLYMLGVQPVRDPMGRISDLTVIPLTDLGRPRIDVVVQTSGQLRDIAASRLFLINKAVEMVSALSEEGDQNLVAVATKETEQALVKQGMSPKEAREFSTMRVFGGVNGNYSTGITGMVESSDRWENEDEVARTYLSNMGAIYGSEKNWGSFHTDMLKTVLQNTDVVIHARQSNTWGPLSLDHVYEFMGGINLAVRYATQKDPEAYLSDFRNRHNPRMQEVKEAIGVEAHTTLLNPAFIQEQMAGSATGAESFAETFRNIFGWSVMKPVTIDQQLWDDLYDTYIIDKNKLGIEQYFSGTNPAALEEISAVMLEGARKGYWKASPEKLTELSKLHLRLIKSFGAGCSGFVCDNVKLKQFISEKLEAKEAADYEAVIEEIRQAPKSDHEGKNVVLKKEDAIQDSSEAVNETMSWVMVIGALLAFLALMVWIKNKRS